LHHHDPRIEKRKPKSHPGTFYNLEYFYKLSIVKKLCCILTLLIAALAVNAQAIKGTYAIKNVATGMVLRVKDAQSANGTPLVSYSPVNWKCVTWDFKQVEGQTYQLKNLFTGKTFQPRQSPIEGALMEEQPLASQNVIQEYDFLPAEENSYLIRMKDTDLYLTPADEKGATNSGILLAKKNGGKLQRWILEEQHPTM